MSKDLSVRRGGVIVVTPNIPRKRLDMLGKNCPRCTGTLEETLFFDDLDGVVHCNVCGLEVNRWG